MLLYIKPVEHVKAALLDSTVLPSLKTIDQIITDLNYTGKPVYLPPKYLKTPKDAKAFIPSKKKFIIPSPAEVAKQKMFLTNPKGICLTPPGLNLANLYEHKLKKSFTEVDLNYLQNNLPKIFIETLEIAEDLEINTQNNTIQVKISGSTYQPLYEQVRTLSNIHGSLGCPLLSSIAIALTRTTGNPIVIQKTTLSENGTTIEAYYQIIKEHTPQQKETR